MSRVSDILADRLDRSLDPTDMEKAAPTLPPLSDSDLIDRLHGVAGVLAADVDMQPPARIRHLHTIDQAIRRLRK